MPTHEHRLAKIAADGSGAMFDRIAERYDLINRVLSLGIDRRWRKRAVAALQGVSTGVVLDLACGTGDVSAELFAANARIRVLGLDPSASMLRVARRKLAGRCFEALLADGQKLPLRDNSVDAAIVAFGIRNVPDRRLALTEMNRVVRPGGQVVLLELSEPRAWRGALFRAYFHVLAPLLGALLSRAGAYRYLVRSVAAFPAAPDFAALMAACGLGPVEIQRLTLGAAYLYLGRVA